MTSYGRDETFALYLAVLKKTDASPLLPESDEDPGVGTRATEIQPSKPDRRRRSRRVTVTIDFDRLQQRILPVTGVPSRQYSQLKAGASGTVFFLETPTAAGARGNMLHRFRLSDRKSEQFQSTVAEYAVSADGKKLVYRTRAAAGESEQSGRDAGAAAAVPRRCRQGRAVGHARPTRRDAADASRSEGGVHADLQRRLAPAA